MCVSSNAQALLIGVRLSVVQLPCPRWGYHVAFDQALLHKVLSIDPSHAQVREVTLCQVVEPRFHSIRTRLGGVCCRVGTCLVHIQRVLDAVEKVFPVMSVKLAGRVWNGEEVPLDEGAHVGTLDFAFVQPWVSFMCFFGWVQLGTTNLCKTLWPVPSSTANLQP